VRKLCQEAVTTTAVARTLHNMGAVYAGAKDYGNAEKAYEESILRLRTTLGADHPDVAAALHNAGRFLKANGDLVGAEKAFREVLDIRLRKLGQTHPEIATARLSLGAVLVLERRFEEPLTPQESSSAVVSRSDAADRSKSEDSRLS